MKIIKYIFLTFWTLWCFIGILKNFSHYGFTDWIFILIFTMFSYIIIVIVSKRKRQNQKCGEKSQDITDQEEKTSIQNISRSIEYEQSTAYIETENTIYRTDGKTISDEQIPYLIQAGYENAITAERNEKNPKFHRTEQEENLSFNFIEKYGSQVDDLTEKFESAFEKAYKTKDLDERISLLNESIQAFEKAKKFCYSKGKGGTIYFQDMWEHLHNSRNECFSYLNNIEDSLEESIFQRDIAIPKIVDIITHTPGILQKNIYKLLPDMDKSTIPYTIKILESENRVSRIKKGNTYELHIHE